MLLLLAGCADPAERLVIAGSSTLQPVLEIAAQAYEDAHPDVQIDVHGGGSSVGIAAARSGLAGIGMVSRALAADEADLVATTIGLDGVAIVVHASNPLDAIRKDQVVGVYGGDLASWSDLGGADRPITVVNKEEGRATLELFERWTGLKGRFTSSALIIGPNGQAITTVAGDPDAVAYVSIGSAAVAEAEGAPIRRLALDGVEATDAEVESGRYPLSRPLNLVTAGPPTGLAGGFVAFLLSAEGQEIVREQDFVPVARGR